MFSDNAICPDDFINPISGLWTMIVLFMNLNGYFYIVYEDHLIVYVCVVANCIVFPAKGFFGSKCICKSLFPYLINKPDQSQKSYSE